jgi:hypothetical protein
MELEPHELASILYKASSALALPFELDFKPTIYLKFANDYFYIPIILVVLYLLFAYFGSKTMKNLQAFNLRYPLALWNAALSIFSFIGMFRTVPFLLATILSKPFKSTICTDPLSSEGN